MKILFIGGTGNISSACVLEALARGWDVTLLNRGQSQLPVPAGVRVLHADVRAYAEANQALEGHTFDAVANFIAFNAADVERDIQLFAQRTRQYVFISSTSAYQKPPLSPVITEKTPLANPFWDYARDKIAAEETLMRAYREKGFPVTIIRPSLTYQYFIPLPIGKNGTFIHRLRQGKPLIVHGDGTSVWTVTHSRDFARGFAGLIGQERAIGEAFHITADELLTWNQIYQLAAQAVGIEPRLVHIPSDWICRHEPRFTGTLLGDKSWSAIFDNSKLKSVVPDFQAAIPFREGIQRTVDWFLEDPARLAVDVEVDRAMDGLIARFNQLG